MSTNIITDYHIRSFIARDFAGHGGGQRLADRLHCSNSTATLIRRGQGTLEKVAALYGYVAGDEPGTWIKSDKPVNPRFVGYIRWTPDLLAAVEYDLSHRRSTHSIAAAIGIERKHLIEIMRLHGVKKPSRPQSYPGCSMPAGFTASLRS